MNASWYYDVELSPGVMSGGRRRGTLAMARDFYRRIDIEGQRCLDIGTQEGVAPALWSKRSPSLITAYDRLHLSDRINAIRSAYGDFEYVSGIALSDLRDQLMLGNEPIYDFVNFSGVLYHMVDPLSELAMARSFLREGGIMMLETSALISDDMALAFNTAGKYHQGSNYFQVSTALLEYMVRLLRLEPIDVAWVGGVEQTCRVLMILRARNEVMLPVSDEWSRRHWVEDDFAPFGLDFRSLATSLSEVGYTPINGATSLRHIRDLPKHRIDHEYSVLRLSHEY